ncbi:MAG: hypothetical protein AAF563_19870 [Pseudomonadota bacterium]
MRIVLSLMVVLMLTPATVHAQYDDPDADLLNIEPGTVDPDSDQIDIPLGDDSSAKDAETDRVTEETLCCQMPDDVRAADELCANVECP